MAVSKTTVKLLIDIIVRNRFECLPDCSDIASPFSKSAKKLKEKRCDPFPKARHDGAGLDPGHATARAADPWRCHGRGA